MRIRLTVKWRVSLLFAIISSIAGCATVRPSHPQQMQASIVALSNNQPQVAVNTLNTDFYHEAENGKPLANLELGRITQLVNLSEQSQQYYQRVEKNIAASQAAARIQASQIFNNLAAIMTSDRALPYDIADYEMTFLYTYQALNYLSQNNLSDALVSIRRLSNAQYWIVQQRSLAKRIKEQKQVNHLLSANKTELENASQVQQTSQLAGKITNSAENGFSYYVAALLYLAYDQDYNNAWVSIRHAKRLLPNNPYVDQTYQQIQKGFNGHQSLPNNKGRLVVLYSQGTVAQKKVFRFPLLLGNGGIQQLAIPYYSSDARLLPPVSVQITQQDQKIVKHQKTAMLVNTNAMAAAALRQAYPVIWARQIMRIITKAQITHQLDDRDNDHGRGVLWLLANFYNILTAQADQRSWLLLPNNVQLYTNSLPQGHYQLQIAHQAPYSVTITPGKTTLVWIISVGNYQMIKQFHLSAGP